MITITCSAHLHLILSNVDATKLSRTKSKKSSEKCREKIINLHSTVMSWKVRRQANLLLSACANGEDREFNRLLHEEGGADLLKCREPKNHMTPLILAATKGQKEVVELLLSQHRKKLDIDATCQDKATALIGAAYHGKTIGLCSLSIALRLSNSTS